MEKIKLTDEEFYQNELRKLMDAFYIKNSVNGANYDVLHTEYDLKWKKLCQKSKSKKKALSELNPATFALSVLRTNHIITVSTEEPRLPAEYLNTLSELHLKNLYENVTYRTMVADKFVEAQKNYQMRIVK